jgi:proteasome lid subunit RPN8/RPN11
MAYDLKGVLPITPSRWLHELLARCQRALGQQASMPAARTPPAALREAAPSAPVNYQPLQRVVLTEGVAQTLIEEYATHRKTERGAEETGWVLLGRREEAEATVRATLPAGADREAGEAHVRFNSVAQGIGSWIIRQADRRLAMLGVVHTHPGTLRHPSDGDYRGDIQWVGQLRGGEGIFGIGTAEGKYSRAGAPFWHPRANMYCQNELCITWYTLREGAKDYQPIPIQLTPGTDLGSPLRLVWDVLEDHATRLERLALQQTKVVIDVSASGLTVTMPLNAGPKLRITLSKEGVRYFVVQGDELLATDLQEPRVDRGVYQLMAELAGDEKS